ncbi:acyltransferase [Pikeienuella sp. HZG-20]|uniref:acyltransferase n=1 Tax=Paludibacillus litoralis TaxID=3133267 RepID=UPI0030ED5E3A
MSDAPIEIQEGAIVDQPGGGPEPSRFGPGGVLRRGTIVYTGVTAGRNLQTGHHVTIRGGAVIGDHVVIGTNTVLDGVLTIGDFVKIETGCYLPTHMSVGNRVFIGPCVTFTNDRYPLKMRDAYLRDGPQGAHVEDLVTIGGGCTICPGVRIGRGSFVAAGAIVTRDAPPMSLVIGAPARIEPLPDRLREDNMALSWRDLIPADGDAQ